MLPSDKDVIGYLNRDIFNLNLSQREFCRSCKKDIATCGGCGPVQDLAKAIIAYKQVTILISQKHAVEKLEMMEND